MAPKVDRFRSNQLYKLLSTHPLNPDELLQQVNTLLHQQPDLVEMKHPKDGSYLHVVCQNFHQQEDIASRLIYALANAGADPNVPDGEGNTPLHKVFKQGAAHHSFHLIQALFRIGVDPRLNNYDGKSASAYIRNNQLKAFCKVYGEGIWHAIETVNIEETARLMNGFLKIDCKHNSNKTLLDKARDLNSPPIIDILADYQVTTEFVHSILAFDWDRASIIYEHENNFLKFNARDSIHRFTSHHRYSKSLLDYCLESQCSKPFEILFQSPAIKIDVNILCTDGLPFFFHCFQPFISKEIRSNILLNSNMLTKSSKGETFLFHLMRLYTSEVNPEYITLFKAIIINNPLLIAQRNEEERSIVEVIELSTSMNTYKKLQPFYEAVKHLLVLHLKSDLIIEQLILNSFGYDLVIYCRNKTLLMTKYVYRLLRNLKSNRGFTVWITSFLHAVVMNDLTRVAYILSLKKCIHQAKDSFGRTGAHLAVLHQRYDILKFFTEKYPNIINIKDNMNRTSYHYACLMNDTKSVEMLEQAKAIPVVDCWDFSPKDYLLNRDYFLKQFQIEDFAKDEIQRQSVALSNFLKIVFYSNLKKATETNSTDDIKLLHYDITKMGYHLKDLRPTSQSNDYVQGYRYIPLLFIGLEHRSIPAIKTLIRLGLPVTGEIQIMKSQMSQHFRSKYFPTQPNLLQDFDIMEMIDNITDDNELKDAFKQDLTVIEDDINELVIKTEHENKLNFKKFAKRRMILSNLIKDNKSTKNDNPQSCSIF
ncbi:unnamed protein product [Adineta ricciae]|uniref:Uncharacterized protein n=1 Tax=Adineta ricciae TaxID=249248 RepID=A0A814UJX3_ADIRI|nr:unnamed protein product [Adineta ricciae]CAF1175730.1 unnamed protein product [Adineta ricciae]